MEIFKADSKAESISVQGAKKFEKIVNFNKQLRQFKKVHDRNKIICQESLGEKSDEDENFIPALPEPKELSRRYTKYEKPKISRKRSEKMLMDFQEKHKKLTAAFHQTTQERSTNGRIGDSSAGTKEKEKGAGHGPEDSTKEKQSPVKIKLLEEAIFKGIESLNIDKKEDTNIEDDENLEKTHKLNGINLLSTTIDETFETFLDNLPEKETKTETQSARANIRQLIMKFEAPKLETEQKEEEDSEKKQQTGHSNGKDSFLSSKFLDVFTKTTPIFSSIEDNWSPTNSMNQEVINFQEELLNFEADSLNPPDENTKRMSFSNTKAMRRLSFDEMEAENFEKERTKLKERNERRQPEPSSEGGGCNFLPSGVSDDKHSDSSSRNPTSKSVPTNHSSPPVSTIKDLRPAFQNGFLNSHKAGEKTGEKEEKKTSPKISLTSEFKHRFLSSFSFEKSPPDTLESSIFGSSGKSHESYQVKENNSRKKSVHFEGEEEKTKKEIEISPVGSYFPIIGSILSAGPTKLKVAEISPEKKVPDIRLQVGSRKESLESIETVDTVDLELIKLGLHKSSGRTGASEEISPLATSLSALSSVTCSVSSSTAQSPTSSEPVTASSQYISLLKNEEKITKQNARLASKSMAQKSNFEVSKSLNVLTAGPEERGGPPLPQPGAGPRPALRPMLMMGYMGPARGTRGLSPRVRFPPPHLRSRPGDIPRVSPGPPPRMMFFRSPSPTHGLIRITPRHLPPRGYRGPSPGGSPPIRPPLPPGFPPAAVRSVKLTVTSVDSF